MMNRRTFLCGLTLGTLSAPLAAEAQPAGKIPRVGVLALLKFSEIVPLWEAFREGLREHGYVEGTNIVVEYRSADGRPARLAELAAELVGLPVDILVAQTTPGTAAAKKATTKIPIIMLSVADPIGAGFVASLARPGGNLTGLSLMSVDLGAKRLELLKALLPTTSRVALLWNPTNPAQSLMLPESQTAARALGLVLLPIGLVDADGIERAFAAIMREHAHGLMVFEDSITVGNSRRIVELAGQHRLLAMYGARLFVEAGGLMAFGPNGAEHYRGAAVYIDKILKGAQPADLPIEQPTKFELVINMKTAKALGLTIPQSLLLRADHVIE